MLADRYEAFLFDLDGVLYRGSRPIPGAEEAVRRLREFGRGIAFVTNSSARTPRAVAERLRSMGIDASAHEVETSASAAAELIASRGLATVFLIGEDGIRNALAEAGVHIADGEPDAVDAVVVGFDRSADYAALRTASVLVQRGAQLVATNGDASYPGDDGFLWPEAGALSAVIEVTTGARAEVAGKPQAPMLEAARRRAGGGLALVIGDRLDTDIAGAVALGWDSLLVLTGVSTREEAAAGPWRPTFVGDDLTVLFE